METSRGRLKIGQLEKFLNLTIKKWKDETDNEKRRIYSGLYTDYQIKYKQLTGNFYRYRKV